MTRRQPDRLTDHGVGYLELDQRYVGPLEGFSSLAHLAGSQEGIRTGRNCDGVLSGGLHQDQRGSRCDLGIPAQVPNPNSFRSKSQGQPRSKVILSDPAHELNPSSGPRGCHRLICPLPTGKDLESIRHPGLTRRRKAIEPCHQIHVGTAHDHHSRT